MKYYKGTLTKCSGTKNLDKCSICGKQSLSHKLREDKKLVCISCWFKDKEAEDLGEMA
jgi:uncharacterized membrane protein